MNKRNKKYFIFLLGTVFLMIMGFAVISSTLNINGTATINSSNWCVKFQNINIDSSSTVSGTQSIINDSTINFSLTLDIPGDKYVFTVDVVNTGGIDAMVDSLDFSLTEDESKLLNYNVTYSDGLEILSHDKLVKETGSETIKVVIEYKKNITASDLPSTPISFSSNIKLTYVQADDTSVTRDLDELITLAKTTTLPNTYLGRTYNVYLGTTYGTHSIRISNVSTPSVCNDEDFSKTACGVVMEFTDVVFRSAMKYYGYYGTNDGGWPDCIVRNTLNNSFYNNLPTNLKNAIIDTTVIAGYGKDDANGTGPDNNYVSTDKIYLLDVREVLGDNAPNYVLSYNKAYNYERQLDYYFINNVTFSSYSKAIKSYYDKTEEYCRGCILYNLWWRLRTANVNSDYGYFSIDSDGDCTLSGAGSDPGGISPAFRIA